MKETDIKNSLGKEDIVDLIGKQWMLVTAGTKENFNTMTASWGGIGFLWDKPVAFIFIRPERYTHDFIENEKRLTLSFYTERYRKALQICGTKSGRDVNKAVECGLTPVELDGSVTFSQARMTIVGKKIFMSSMKENEFIDKGILGTWYDPRGGGLHDVYVLEIEKIVEGED
ncbi:MAG: flavin reductase [Bacteroidales bacterium]|nr:flavin reductase [Bacteroidales bacterium]